MNNPRKPNQEEISDLIKFIAEQQVKNIPPSLSFKEVAKAIKADLSTWSFIAVFDNYWDEASCMGDYGPPPRKAMVVLWPIRSGICERFVWYDEADGGFGSFGTIPKLDEAHERLYLYELERLIRDKAGSSRPQHGSGRS